MKILLAIPGHLKTVPMNKFTETALRGLGHKVIIVDFKASITDKVTGKFAELLQNNEPNAGVNQRIRRVLSKEKPDLLFTIFGFDISKETLDHARNLGTRSVCWWINDPFQFERGLKSAANYDIWFSNSSVCAAEITEKTGTKAYFLPAACDPATHRPTAPHSEFLCDVCFAGDWSAGRESLVLGLIEAGIDLRVYGPWQNKLPANSPILPYLHHGFFNPEEMSNYFCSAKLVLNFHTWYGKANHGVNPRLFEAAGCRVVQLVDAKLELAQLFDINTSLAVYETLEELPALIRSLLADPARCKNMAKSAYQRALQEHTYQHRMRKMLSYL